MAAKKLTDHTYSVSVNNLPAALKKLDLPAEQVEIVTQYKDQFPFLLEEGENVLVSLEQLWEALDTPYYSKLTVPELTAPVKTRNTPAKEAKYKRRKFTQWRDEVALKETDGEVFSRMVSTGKTKKKETFVTVDDAKMIAMTAPGEQGRKIRRYFVAVEKIAKQLYQYNLLRYEIDGRTKKVYQEKVISLGARFQDPRIRALGGKEATRFNTLLKKVAGARNVKETDLDEYAAVQVEVYNAMKRGRTDTEILKYYDLAA